MEATREHSGYPPLCPSGYKHRLAKNPRSDKRPIGDCPGCGRKGINIYSLSRPFLAGHSLPGPWRKDYVR